MKIPKNHDSLDEESLFVANNKFGKGLFVSKNFKRGDAIFYLNGEITKSPTKYSVEVGENEHITDKFGSYLNHSCDPNVKISRKERAVRAVRDIIKGEEITFNYNSNESYVSAPFNCLCGSKNCQGLIKGASKKQK